MPDFTVRVTPYEKEGSNIKGLASINFEGMSVSNVSIRQGKEDSLFVSMPSYKTNQVDERGKTVYKDVCHPITAKFRDKLYGAVLQEYEKALEHANEKGSVLGKLSENKEVIEKAEKSSITNEKAATEHNQQKRDEAQR